MSLVPTLQHIQPDVLACVWHILQVTGIQPGQVAVQIQRS
jgi:hypothetical protein